jgi:hypothetical protein
MRIPHVDTVDRAEARQEAAALIRRRRRQGFPVAMLQRGRAWEVLEPEGALMVPDQCGTISLQRDVFTCGECDSEHDTAADARECCTHRDLCEYLEACNNE